MSDFPDFNGDFEVWLFLSHLCFEILKIIDDNFYINYFISRKIVWAEFEIISAIDALRKSFCDINLML